MFSDELTLQSVAGFDRVQCRIVCAWPCGIRRIAVVDDEQRPLRLRDSSSTRPFRGSGRRSGSNPFPEALSGVRDRRRISGRDASRSFPKSTARSGGLPVGVAARRPARSRLSAGRSAYGIERGCCAALYTQGTDVAIEVSGPFSPVRSRRWTVTDGWRCIGGFFGPGDPRLRTRMESKKGLSVFRSAILPARHRRGNRSSRSRVGSSS